MIRILIAGVIAGLLAMTLMEKRVDNQVSPKGDLKNLPADTAKQLDAIMEKNKQQKENALKSMGIN